MKQGVKILIGLAILAFFALWGYVRYLESVSVFHPSREILSTPKEAGLDYEEVNIESKDGPTLNGWFIKHPQARSTILYLHGNAGNIGDRVEKIVLLHQLGLNVFIIDYRGYGRSSGAPTEAGLYEDALDAFSYLSTRPDIDPERIIVYGGSLGGVAGVNLASKRKLFAIIIDSSFTSAADMGKIMYPFIPSFFMQIKLDALSKIKSLQIPKLIIHSSEDDLVPFWMGQKLFESAPPPKEFLQVSGTHNDGHIVAKDIWLKGLKSFLTKYHLK